jgi:hypothetical protein
MSAVSTWPGGLMPAAFARVSLGRFQFSWKEKLIADWLAWLYPGSSTSEEGELDAEK